MQAETSSTEVVGLDDDSFVQFSSMTHRQHSDDFVQIWLLNKDGKATKWDAKNPHPGYEANHDDFEGHEGYG